MLLNSQSWARVIFFHDLSASLYHVVLSNMYSASPFTTVFIQYLYSSMMFRVLNHHFSNCQNLFFKFQCRPFPPLLAVNLHPPRGGQPPPLLAVNLHHLWQSTSTLRCGQPTSLLVVIFHSLWLSTSTLRGSQPPSLVAVPFDLPWQSTSISSGS